MTPLEQKNFVRELSDSIVTSILNTIDDGLMPEEFDGHELRWLLADKFASTTYNTSKQRKAIYNNVVRVNNLV